MLKYVILTPSIAFMGGAQMYTYNKCEYLKTQGWTPIVIHCIKGKVVINGLSQFEDNYVSELGYGIQYHTKRSVKGAFDKIYSIINADSNDVIVIESQLQILSFWGEELAARLRAKHILNFLEEDVPVCTKRASRFFEFKLIRREILNASVASLKRLFQDFYKEDYSQHEHKSSFFCSNVTSEITSEEYELPEADYTIMSIGRLNKPYILPMVQEIRLFVREYKRNLFNVVIVGASPNGKVEEIINHTFADCSNVELLHYGYLYPVPSNLVKQANVTISASNSVLVSYDLGVPTISMDAADFIPIGLYGVTTMSRIFRNEEVARPLSLWLKEILIDQKYEIHHSNEQNTQSNDGFAEQLLFVEKTAAENDFYNIRVCFTRMEYFVCNLKRILHKLIE